MIRGVLVWAAAALATAIPPALAADPARSPTAEYEPPHRGAPQQKLGSGLRAAVALPTVRVLAPEQMATTTASSPSLFWHVDALPPRDARFVFTLITALRIDPILEVDLPSPTGPGIRRVRLSDHGVILGIDTDYEWSVSIQADSRGSEPSRMDRGYIRRVSAPEEAIRKKGSQQLPTPPSDWYDALEALSDRIDRDPDNPALQAQRNTLLIQGGLAGASDMPTDNSEAAAH